MLPLPARGTTMHMAGAQFADDHLLLAIALLFGRSLAR
jgi:hypothetical protein